MAEDFKEKLDAKQSEAICAVTSLAVDNAAKNAEQDAALERSNKNDIATAKALAESREKDKKQDNAIEAAGYKLELEVAKLNKKINLIGTVAIVCAIAAFVTVFLIK